MNGETMAWLQDNETFADSDNYVVKALNYINKLNESRIAKEIKCYELQQREELELSLGTDAGRERQGCEISWDSLLCWPRTPPGTMATLPCLEELNGIRYDSTRLQSSIGSHLCGHPFSTDPKPTSLNLNDHHPTPPPDEPPLASNIY